VTTECKGHYKSLRHRKLEIIPQSLDKMVTLEESIEEKVKRIRQDSEKEARLQTAKELTAEVQAKQFQVLLILHDVLELSFGTIAKNIGFFWPCNKQFIHETYKKAKLWEANKNEKNN